VQLGGVCTMSSDCCNLNCVGGHCTNP
jgi:hypothetical protein